MVDNPNRVRIPVAQFAAKFSSKNETYTFLTQDVKAYCPPKDTVTAWHLRDLAMGAKGIVKATDLKHLYVPYLHEVLTIETVLAWAKTNHPQYVEHYFPIYKELIKFPRQVSE